MGRITSDVAASTLPTSAPGSVAHASPHARARRRRRSGGLTAIEDVLMIAAIAGCFLYPLSRAAIGSGRRLAQSVEAAHETILHQR